MVRRQRGVLWREAGGLTRPMGAAVRRQERHQQSTASLVANLPPMVQLLGGEDAPAECIICLENFEVRPPPPSPPRRGTMD